MASHVQHGPVTAADDCPVAAADEFPVIGMDAAAFASALEGATSGRVTRG